MGQRVFHSFSEVLLSISLVPGARLGRGRRRRAKQMKTLPLCSVVADTEQSPSEYLRPHPVPHDPIGRSSLCLVGWGVALRQDRKSPPGPAQLGKAMLAVDHTSRFLGSALTLAGCGYVLKNPLTLPCLLTIADHVLSLCLSLQDFLVTLLHGKLQKTWPCFLICRAEIITVPPSLGYWEKIKCMQNHLVWSPAVSRPVS